MARSDGNYLVIRGYVDGTIQGERSFDTQQEAEYYGKQMLAYIKKMNPKAKKVTVDIDSMTNHSPGPKIKTLASRPGEPDTFAVEDRFYFGKGRKERFASKEQAIAFIKQYKRNEDSNAHSENVVLLAKFMGNSRAAKLASLVQQINEVAGHMPHGVGQFQYNELHAPLWKQFIAQYGDLYASVK